MDNQNRIEFKLSKSKLIGLLFVSVIFITLGIAFIVDPEKYISYSYRSSSLIFIVGIASVIFASLGLIIIIKKLFDKTPGLVIDDKGIFDNASGVSAGFIPWSDVIEITETKVANQSFVNVIVKNPQFYLEKKKNVFTRKLIEINYKSFGTVIGIPSNAINCEFEELLEILKMRFENSKKPK
jgi:hypothetical protein